MKYFISLPINDNNFAPCLQISFMKDGGFFIMPIGLGNEDYLVSKIKIPNNKFGANKIPWDKKMVWRTNFKPKLTHHIDGSAQISGTGIRSGFYKTNNKPKGVYVNSIDLILNNNDGGPLFTSLFWGLQFFKKRKRRGKYINVEKKFILNDPYEAEDEENLTDGIVVEGFYLNKKICDKSLKGGDTISIPHPNYGVIPLKIIFGNKPSPGHIGLFIRHSRAGFDSEFGASLGGGPGMTLPEGGWEQINILYPFSEKDEKDDQSIEYKGIYKLYSYIDNIIFKLRKLYKKH